MSENFQDLLAPLLWGTPGVIAALIQEVISVYPFLTKSIEMDNGQSNRCCNALALLQCVASHPETRGLFLRDGSGVYCLCLCLCGNIAQIPLFLYPFLNTRLQTKPFEYLRLTSLGVIGALEKDNEKKRHEQTANRNKKKKGCFFFPTLHFDIFLLVVVRKNNQHPHPNVSGNVTATDKNVTEFLVQTEAIPLCLQIMEHGNELSKTVATFIIQKILLDDLGLAYVCKTSERFFAVSRVLKNIIEKQTRHLSKTSGENNSNTTAQQLASSGTTGTANNDSRPSRRLIKHVIRCYLRLCDDSRAYRALSQLYPEFLSSPQVREMFADDENCTQWLEQLQQKKEASESEALKEKEKEKEREIKEGKGIDKSNKAVPVGAKDNKRVQPNNALKTIQQPQSKIPAKESVYTPASHSRSTTPSEYNDAISPRSAYNVTQPQSVMTRHHSNPYTAPNTHNRRHNAHPHSRTHNYPHPHPHAHSQTPSGHYIQR
ncbi:cell differentiation protein rcd1 [Reticulomyxa filosa]|uniref:Cell differentiation protein rcd1 n=1 Tax=Reticulomyxa filosa TaxID=46433 RepID=X6MHJ8_RETFI|nr:cell differentiation protein rcd1 [Reticulomyxa filosa]|eukprot:ETO13478.1 cell differentiation protein rcd1 [Reticulomyxa filosa]